MGISTVRTYVRIHKALTTVSPAASALFTARTMTVTAMTMMVTVPLGTRRVLGNPHLEAPRTQDCALLKVTGLVRVWAACHLLLRD